MAVVLTVDRPKWHGHIAATLEAFDGHIIAVVKGNGYGFGREQLMSTATGFAIGSIAVGTVFELAGTESYAGDVLALTPSFGDLTDVGDNAVVTVASTDQLAHLRRTGHRGRVAIKLQSSMRRHGFDPADLPAAADLAGLDLHSFIIHLPLVGSSDEHIAEIDCWLPQLPGEVPISVSHLDPVAFAELRRQNPARTFTVRMGTALWHGDKSAFRLRADVLDVRPVHGGDTAGYRATRIGSNGTLVLIGAGSAQGVVPLGAGLSPFHHRATRLTLVEAPHMHTSMAFIPAGQAVPETGEWVDVQRPLTMTQVDRIDWIDKRA